MGIKRLLVSDMDGTLLDQNQRVSAETQAAVLRFLNQGGKFAVATGRSLSSVSRFVRPLGIEYGILLSGALVYDFVNACAVERHPLPVAPSRAFVRTILERCPDVSVQVYGEQVVCLLRANEIVSARGIREEFCDLLTPEAFLPAQWLKLTLSGPIPAVEAIQAEVASAYPELAALRSSRYFCEVTGAGVNKGLGLETLSRLYDIPLAEMVAVGDNENDLPMFQRAGWSMAVENAREAVRACADDILPDHNAHPIKHAAELILREM